MSDPGWPDDRGRAEHVAVPRRGNRWAVTAVSVLLGASSALVTVGLAWWSRPADPPPPTVAIARPSSPASFESHPPPSRVSGSDSANHTPAVAQAAPTAAGPAVFVPAAPGRNPLNRRGIGIEPTVCALPRFDASAESQDAYFEATLTCLDRAWKPVLEAADLPFHGPEVVPVVDEVDTPCGPRDASQTALYCSGTIYMTGNYYRDIEGHGDHAAVYFGQLAHEYGHHVQALAGIMDASWDRRNAAKPESRRGHEISRRFELQATCFGGMFLGSVRERGAESGELAEDALADAGRRGDDPRDDRPDHGTPESNGAWAQLGHELNRTHQCNTWLAEADAVR
ncbi:neutral zinc metallopeptidase [Parasphingorhabdus pacifica]